MSELVSQLGLDWKIILAQIVNFAILAFFLTKFLYKPVIKILDERKNNLEENERKILETEESVKNADIAKEEILSLARKESEKIIKQSEKGSKEIKDNLLKEAQNEAEKIKIDTKKQMQLEKDKALEDVKKDLGSLVALVIEKSLGNVATKETQNKLVEEAVRMANKK